LTIDAAKTKSLTTLAPALARREPRSPMWAIAASRPVHNLRPDSGLRVPNRKIPVATPPTLAANPVAPATTAQTRAAKAVTVKMASPATVVRKNPSVSAPRWVKAWHAPPMTTAPAEKRATARPH
jgi:hypothetical protein